MKVLLLAVALLPAFAQDSPPPAQPATQESQQQPAASPPETPPAENEEQRSVLDVKPGSPAIKNKDLWQGTGYFHPFVRMPRYVANDQKHIWTSPFHVSAKDVKWFAIFGTATAALIATDQFSVKGLPNTSGQVRLGNYTSHIGAAYTLVPLSAGFYLLGTATKKEHFRETGLIAFETLIDTTIFDNVIKAATHRARPLEGDGKGHFWDSSGSFLNASFPSGHAINSFALASVFAHQYRNHIIVPIVAYALAGTVVAARVSARRHFPGDVVSGAALGWFIGDYVFAKRHNTELDKKTISQKVMDHVHFGLSF
jgi:membrane-associated phospholipid phosphatase